MVGLTLSSSLAAEKYFENYFNTDLPNGPEWFTLAHEYALLKGAYTQVTQSSPFFTSLRLIWNTIFINCKSGGPKLFLLSPAKEKGVLKKNIIKKIVTISVADAMSWQKKVCL